MRTTYTLFSALAILAALAVSPATAKDDPLEFLHLLQKEGYSDVAVDYLEQIKADPDAPREIMELWDLEMSRSKKEAAKQAYSDTKAKQLNEESKALLEQFIKANPNRPEAIQEAARWSEEKALEAQYAVLHASYVSDKAEKAKLLATARQTFEEIRPRFVKAYQASVKMLKSLPSSPRTKKDAIRLQEAKIMVGENRLTVAMVDFYMAYTQEGAERTAALTKSIKDFDGIYQDYREAVFEREAFVGWRSHFWHARILQELGQTSDAKLIFEEVVSCDPGNIPEVDEDKQPGRVRAPKATGLEGFFADVEQYYLQALYQLSKKEYLEEADGWRAKHKALSEKTYGYQALTLELAKNCVEIGKKSTIAANQEAAKRKALKLLGEMAKIASPYQTDATKLRRELNPNGSPEEGFEDAVIDADNAVEKKNWVEAAECYEKAIAAKTKNTDAQRLAAAENSLVGCYHNQAMQLYRKKKVDEAIAIVQKNALKKELLGTKNAPGVAVFLLNIQYYQYLEAPEGTDEQKKAKAELLAKVSKSAKSILKIWPAKEEGDAARTVLMRLALAQDDMKEADRLLSEINPASKEYPRALTVMGFAHWYKYRVAKKQFDAEKAKKLEAESEKKAPTAQEKKDEADKLAKIDEDRRQAVDYTEKAVKDMNTPRSAGAAIPETLRESLLLLAEMYLEGKDFKQAGAHYKSLMDDILKDSNKPFDETALRIFDGAGQACLQLNDVESVTLVGSKFAELGPDQAPINVRIMSFTKGLDTMRKKAMAEGDSGDPTVPGTGASKLKSLTDLELKIMINLSKREKLSPPSMVWIVKTTSNLGTDDAKAAAVELIEKIIEKANNDQDFEDKIKPALAGLQSLGAVIQAERKEYNKAKELIDQLIQTYPRALEPKISEAKILTEWAAKDSSKYNEAIAKWDTLRKKLDRYNQPAGDTKPHPKYEVILNEADCFYRWSQKTKSKEDAKKGFDLLSPYLNLDQKIQSPNDEYKELSDRYFQVAGKLADFLGVTKPTRPKVKRPAKSS